MALFIVRESAKKLLRTELFRKSFQIAKISDHERRIIGKREIVGFGINGQPAYIDRPDFPFPAIRWKESCSQLEALREKEKGDWNELTCEEKKALYRFYLLTEHEKEKYILKHFTKQCKIVLQDFRIANRREQVVLTCGKRKKYSCYTCLKKFYTNSDLESHKSVHINSKSTRVQVKKQPARIVNQDKSLLTEKKDLAGTSKEDITSISVTQSDNPKITSAITALVNQEVSDNRLEKVSEKLSTNEDENSTDPQEPSKKCPNNFKYMCWLCITYFNDVSDIKAHNHIPLKCKYYCRKCSRNFTTKNGFVVHALQHDITESKMNDFATVAENKSNKCYVPNILSRFSCGPVERAFSAPKESTLNRTCVTSYICRICYGVYESLEMLNKHNTLHELEKQAEQTKTTTIEEHDLVIDLETVIDIKEEEHAPINTIYEEVMAEEDDIFIEDYDKDPLNLNENLNSSNYSTDTEGDNPEKQWSQMLNNEANFENKNQDTTCSSRETNTTPTIIEEIPTISIPEIFYSNTDIPFSQIDEVGSSSFAAQISLLKKHNYTKPSISKPSDALSKSTAPHPLRLENQILTLNRDSGMTRASLQIAKTPPNCTSNKKILYRVIKLPRTANLQIGGSQTNKYLLRPAVLNPNPTLPSTNEVLNPPAPLLVNNKIIDYNPNISDNIISNRDSENTTQEVTAEQEKSPLISTIDETIEDVVRSSVSKYSAEVTTNHLRRLLLEKKAFINAPFMKLVNFEEVFPDSSARSRGTLSPKPLNSEASSISLPIITDVHTVVENHTDKNKTKIPSSASQYEHEFTKFLQVNNPKNNICTPPNQIRRSNNSRLSQLSATGDHTYVHTGSGVSNFESASALKACPIDYGNLSRVAIDEKTNDESSVEIGNISLTQKIPQIYSSNHCVKPIIREQSSVEETVSTALEETCNLFKEPSLVTDRKADIPKIYVRKLSDLVSVSDNKTK